MQHQTVSPHNIIDSVIHSIMNNKLSRISHWDQCINSVGSVWTPGPFFCEDVCSSGNKLGMIYIYEMMYHEAWDDPADTNFLEKWIKLFLLGYLEKQADKLKSPSNERLCGWWCMCDVVWWCCVMFCLMVWMVMKVVFLECYLLSAIFHT